MQPTKKDQPHNDSPDAARHSRKCVICHHPDRDDIDADYLHWRPATDITRQYQLPHYSTIHRHARATGLRALRRENAYTVLDKIIEQAESVTPSAGAVIRAVRLYAQITGQLREPERTYLITHQGPSGEATSVHTGRRPNLSSHTPGLDSKIESEIRNAATH